MLRNLRPFVFWPTFLVLMAALLFSLIDLTGFLTSVTALNDLILKNFSWVFSLGSFYLVVLAVITYFSPLANLRIGGRCQTNADQAAVVFCHFVHDDSRRFAVLDDG